MSALSLWGPLRKQSRFPSGEMAGCQSSVAPVTIGISAPASEIGLFE
jgi:hypothetical protein